ncbi:unnamed protein product [Urochloa humidicola]
MSHGTNLPPRLQLEFGWSLLRPVRRRPAPPPPPPPSPPSVTAGSAMNRIDPKNSSPRIPSIPARHGRAAGHGSLVYAALSPCPVMLCNSTSLKAEDADPFPVVPVAEALQRSLCGLKEASATMCQHFSCAWGQLMLVQLQLVLRAAQTTGAVARTNAVDM